MSTADKRAIGIDLGATNFKAGLVDGSGNVLTQRAVAITDRSADGVIALMAREVRALADGSDPAPIAVGCGVPGIVNIDAGMLLLSPNFPDWENECIRERIAQATELPVILDNDANMHALGEQRCGAGRGCHNMVLLTLGTGIGGGLVLNGNVFHGEAGFAGEVGHMVVEPEGVSCGLPWKGGWENYAASRAFRVHAEALPEKEREAFLTRAGVTLDGLTPKVAADRARLGDEIALQLWNAFGRYLGIGIANLVNVLGVTTFVIGGGIAISYDLFIDATREEVAWHTYPQNVERLTIVPAQLGGSAGIVGAALEALSVIS